MVDRYAGVHQNIAENGKSPFAADSRRRNRLTYESLELFGLSRKSEFGVGTCYSSDGVFDNIQCHLYHFDIDIMHFPLLYLSNAVFK